MLENEENKDEPTQEPEKLSLKSLSERINKLAPENQEANIEKLEEAIIDLTLRIDNMSSNTETDNPTKQIENLQQCLAKIAHFTGQQRVLDEFGIKRWDIQKKDMSKYNDENKG